MSVVIDIGTRQHIETVPPLTDRSWGVHSAIDIYSREYAVIFWNTMLRSSHGEQEYYWNNLIRLIFKYERFGIEATLRGLDNAFFESIVNAIERVESYPLNEFAGIALECKRRGDAIQKGRERIMYTLLWHVMRAHIRPGEGARNASRDFFRMSLSLLPPEGRIKHAIGITKRMLNSI